MRNAYERGLLLDDEETERYPELAAELLITWDAACVAQDAHDAVWSRVGDARQGIGRIDERVAVLSAALIVGGESARLAWAAAIAVKDAAAARLRAADSGDDETPDWEIAWQADRDARVVLERAAYTAKGGW